MVAHERPIHLAKRQGPDPLSVSDAIGVNPSSTLVVDTAAATSVTNLAFNPTASSNPGATAPPLNPANPFSTPVVTSSVTQISAASSTSEPVPTAADASSGDSSPSSLSASAKPTIAMGTVIGSCVGAFVGASLLILIALWYYKRYSKSLKARVNARGPLSHSRNLNAGEQRRSRLEPWNKLEDSDDKWEDMYQTKEMKETEQVAPMEKLTMFKKTPSVRTAYTHKSTNIASFDFPQTYSDIGATQAQATPMPVPRPFLDRIDVNPEMTSSWETQTGNGSYLSVHSQADGGRMSPTTAMAIPTPHPVASEAHKWESAEVVHYTDAAPIADAASDPEANNRRSIHNPFFNAQDTDFQPRSRSNSVVKSAKSKGKEKMRYSNVSTVSAAHSVNPFEDINTELPPRPTFVQHAATASSSSTESKERALQSLIAALDVSEDEVRDRLRIASMQPSVISQTSTAGYDEEADVTKEFPLPPPRAA
ncbi:hypothetical protein JR316_0005976 [Psilocybe cubensis]|uniref:Uncharacterized protein n=2 Tax=Psilocybe cubensis TaxID=181762 RepID=A0A8H7XYC4_PSICU|nr:hypothetical protein JR316_0005976 [Psilocybe cubensis]KAH9481450.1 hypothetical protein JR316_0005976 [Psilocybe cubensis]